MVWGVWSITGRRDHWCSAATTQLSLIYLIQLHKNLRRLNLSRQSKPSMGWQNRCSIGEETFCTSITLAVVSARIYPQGKQDRGSRTGEAWIVWAGEFGGLLFPKPRGKTLKKWQLLKVFVWGGRNRASQSELSKVCDKCSKVNATQKEIGGMRSAAPTNDLFKCNREIVMFRFYWQILNFKWQKERLCHNTFTNDSARGKNLDRDPLHAIFWSHTHLEPNNTSPNDEM